MEMKYRTVVQHPQYNLFKKLFMFMTVNTEFP